MRKTLAPTTPPVLEGRPLAIQVGRNPDGKVVIDFGIPIVWVALAPEQARAIATELLAHADALTA